jgi:hypothetical protein
MEVLPTEKDLTIHLRCGDFWDHEKNCSQIFDPEDLKKLIKGVEYERLFIVANPATFDWEKEYYKEFDELNPIWINGNMGDDFDFLMKSNKLILSASILITFLKRYEYGIVNGPIHAPISINILLLLFLYMVFLVQIIVLLYIMIY